MINREDEGRDFVALIHLIEALELLNARAATMPRMRFRASLEPCCRYILTDRLDE